MVKYLQMDGVDDYLKTPTITFNEIQIDFSRVYKAWAKYVDYTGGRLEAYSNPPIYDPFWGGNINNVYKNGVEQSNYTTFLTDDERVTLTLKMSSTTQLVNVFSSTDLRDFANGKIYDIKFYNGETLVAHYDMSTGTVQDQSGNGNHATLTGGTWLDDGTGGGETGTEVTSTYASKQSIYHVTSRSYDSKQSINVTRSNDFTSKLVLYKMDASDYRTKQTISKDIDTFYSTSQVITLVGGREVSTLFPTKQLISLVRQDDFTTRQVLRGGFYSNLNLRTSVSSEVKLNAVLSDTIMEVVSYIGQDVYHPSSLRTVSEMEVTV